MDSSYMQIEEVMKSINKFNMYADLCEVSHSKIIGNMAVISSNYSNINNYKYFAETLKDNFKIISDNYDYYSNYILKKAYDYSDTKEKVNEMFENLGK